MNRRKFIQAASLGIGSTCLPSEASISNKQKELEYDRRSHLLGGTYFTPNTLFTPEEIVEEGFIFCPDIKIIHNKNDPMNPVPWNSLPPTNKGDYLDNNPHLKCLLMRTYRWCPWYIKDYDVDISTKRGIHSVEDYLYKKDIFKPIIVAYMKEHKFHYVHKVLLESSPCIFEETELTKKYNGAPWYNYLYHFNIRGITENRLL